MRLRIFAYCSRSDGTDCPNDGRSGIEDRVHGVWDVDLAAGYGRNHTTWRPPTPLSRSRASPRPFIRRRMGQLPLKPNAAAAPLLG